MLLVALITSALTVRVKTQARLAVERERRTEVLYEINKKLLVTRGLENIVTLTNEYITKLFGRSIIFYTQDPGNNSEGVLMQAPGDLDASFMLLEDERAVAHWVFINQKYAGAGTDTLMGAGAFYMPVISQGNVLGVIALSCAKGKLDQHDRLFLRMIISQVAMALERQYLSDEQRRILVESEKEKMRSNLLRAISHDLRTPLTGILGASSAILENGDSLDKLTHNQLISNIKEDSQWLIRMVENLLSVTRINEGTMNVTKSPEAAEEIVAEAISRIRKRFPDRKVPVKVPDELLLVPMDGTLIEQVLINLLENAIKHTPENSMVEVKVRKDRQNAVFEVIDNGEGIAEQDFPYLFESYVPNGKRSADSSRGMGIGLSICMSIVKAHHGKMEAANKMTGGAVFRFTLPLGGGENNE
jgi:two-component system sensor histidine kinase KdpD